MVLLRPFSCKGKLGVRLSQFDMGVANDCNKE